MLNPEPPFTVLFFFSFPLTAMNMKFHALQGLSIIYYEYFQMFCLSVSRQSWIAQTHFLKLFWHDVWEKMDIDLMSAQHWPFFPLILLEFNKHFILVQKRRDKLACETLSFNSGKLFQSLRLLNIFFCKSRQKLLKLVHCTLYLLLFFSTDIEQLLVSKEEVSPEQQERSPSPIQEDPPQPQHVKEEQKELWTSQEEQLQGLEEEDSSTLILTPVPVKNKDVGEKLQLWNHTEQNRDGKDLKTEDREDYGGSEADKNLNPDSHLQPVTHVQASHFSQCETNCMSWYFNHTRQPQSSFNSVQNQDVSGGDFRCKTEDTAVRFSECVASFSPKEQTQKCDRIQTEEKPFVCSVCGQSYRQKNSLTIHMRLHLEGRHVNCPVCKKSFLWQAEVERHMRTHTGEKPFSCQFCGMRFAVSSNLNSHLQVHTGEKPFTCLVCKATFRRREALHRHMRIHTGEKPYSCSICGKGFIQHATLKRHLMVHTGEKPYSCSACDKRFSRLEYLKNHKCVGERGSNSLSWAALTSFLSAVLRL